jgi:hypothetical protein
MNARGDRPTEADGRSSSDNERDAGIRYGYLTDDDLRRSYDVEDRRWARGRQIRDWVVLAILCGGTLLWMIVVYLLEPGLR